ncbi:UNVERIFIED_CONTAM: Vacuolar protein sorting-associated protein 51 [Sesamum indicum]
MEVEGGGVPLDEKARRMRDLLSSFYSPDHAASAASLPRNTSSRFATLDTINTTAFNADQYMNLLVQKSNVEGLLQKHVEMAAEIKNLDTDLQMLVYENYNKFISATDTIKRMKNNIVGMETNMEQLLEKITSVQSRSDGVNTSLFERREHIEKLHRTRNLLRKVQFKEIGTEVKQLLPQSLHHKHRRTNSNGSTASSRSSTLRDDKLIRSNIQKARSQLLESHLAKLFKQKMEIFTKLEHTQVIVSTAERCLDPIPLEPPVLDRLVQAKLPKTSEQNQDS